ncbi:hypothetical protein ACLB2K_002070 [Fragaria x ananassa]
MFPLQKRQHLEIVSSRLESSISPRILVWNCRGIVGGTRRRALVDLIRQEKPRILFLSENLCSEKQLETLRIRIGFDNCLGMASSESSPGVALLWMNDMPVNIQTYSARHIDVTIGAQGSPKEWRLSGIYGYARTGDRGRTWELMRRLARQSSLPWLLVGDFNEILANSEKVGGAPRRLAQMQAFRETLMDCALLDMGYSGSPFTWADHQTKERLDRSLWSVGLRNLFPRSSTTHLHPSTSDHSPLLVEICVNPSPKMRAVRSRLDELMAAPFDPTHHAEKQALNKKFQELLTAVETIWIQRSKALWLKAGDRNTAYFHRRASNRKQHNSLKGLCNVAGERVTDRKDIESVVTSYYSSLFSTDGVNPMALNLILDSVQARVTLAQNHELLAPYMDCEVKAALFQMHPSKAPGPDGMSPFFFQKYWHVVGPDVCTAIKSFLSSGALPAELNFTHMTLIPKIEKHLGSCGIPLQSAFVPDRLISDNTLVATEVAHFLHTNRTAANDHFSLKLDISKAYDRLEWEYIRRILLKLGFAIEWVNLIMTTLNTQFVRNQWITGMQIAPTAPTLHHLLFADDSLFFAELGSRPSFSWRSILSAREVLTQGLRWRVGTGDQIDIWNHKWIPDSFPRCPSSPPPRDAPKLVAELIDPITRTWDIQKLERCFSSADVDLILSIPLSRRPIADKLIWHFHKKANRVNLQDWLLTLVGTVTKDVFAKQAVSQPDTDLSTLGTIIAEVKEFLHRYADFRVLHVSREANRVAYILANHALNYSESQSWFVVAPEFVRDVILSDCSHSLFK